MSKPTPGNGRVVIEVPKADEPIKEKDDTTQEQQQQPQQPQQQESGGEIVKDGLKFIDTIGIRDELEKGVMKIDADTPEEISKETELITERMNKLDVLITIGLYYTSLFMDWLTLLGRSTSVGNFFFDLFLKSFNLSQWDFGDLSLVAEISGMTTTLQTGIFFGSSIINVGARLLKKPVPNFVGGPMYYGGPFQIVFALMPKVKDYTDSIKSLDAKISQWMGFFSQVLIIIAAIFAAVNRVKALDPFTQGSENLIGGGYVPKPDSEDQFGKVISPTNTTQVTLAVQNAALFARATYFVSVVAIIMTSFLNIIQWLADVWRVNKDDLLVYTLFKVLTRVLLCQPCFGDKFLGNLENVNPEKKEKRGSSALSRGIPTKSKVSPLLKSRESEEKFDEKKSSEGLPSLVIPTEQENQSLLSPGQSSSKKLERNRSVRRK